MQKVESGRVRGAANDDRLAERDLAKRLKRATLSLRTPALIPCHPSVVPAPVRLHHGPELADGMSLARVTFGAMVGHTLRCLDASKPTFQRSSRSLAGSYPFFSAPMAVLYQPFATIGSQECQLP